MGRLRHIVQTFRQGPIRLTEKVYKIEYSDIIREKIRKEKSLNIHLLNEQTCCDINTFRGNAVVKQFRKMCSKGQLCFAMYCNDVAIGHASIIFPKCVKEEFIIRDSAYIHFCFVAESMRGRGIYPLMLVQVMDFINEKYKINEFSISTSLSNVASTKGIEKVGFSLMTEWKYKKWGRFCWEKIVV